MANVTQHKTPYFLFIFLNTRPVEYAKYLKMVEYPGEEGLGPDILLRHNFGFFALVQQPKILIKYVFFDKIKRMFFLLNILSRHFNIFNYSLRSFF